jgi:hypothetical protein
LVGKGISVPLSPASWAAGFSAAAMTLSRAISALGVAIPTLISSCVSGAVGSLFCFGLSQECPKNSHFSELFKRSLTLGGPQKSRSRGKRMGRKNTTVCADQLNPEFAKIISIC